MSSKNSLFKNISHLLLPDKRKIVLVCIYMILGTATNIVLPLINMEIIDRGIVALNISALLWLSGASLCIYIISRTLDFAEFKQLNQIRKRVELELLSMAQNHLLRLPMEYFKENNEAQITNNLNYDISKINRITDRTMFVSIAQGFGIVGGIIGLCAIDARLLILVVLATPIKILTMRYFAQKREGFFALILPMLNSVGAWWGDTIGNIETVKLWNLYSKKTTEFQDLKGIAIDKEIERQYNDKFSENVDWGVDFILKLLIYIVGFCEIVHGRLSIGGLFAFATYSSQVLSPISFITKIQFYFSEIRPSMNRFIGFLEIPEEAQLESTLRVDVPEKISFVNVSLRIKDTLILSNINLDLLKGQKVAIVGENGSGKTSLLNLILRFYEPTEGTIYFDDLNVQELNLAGYRQNISAILQRTKLFNTTVCDNIDPLHTMPEVELYRNCLHWGYGDLIDSLPKQLITVVGENGSKLSGGESQKISAIRAFIKSAKILVIDEATSNYDLESENHFDKLIGNFDSYDYLIVVTHRKGILEKMDRVIQLDGGRIIADSASNLG